MGCYPKRLINCLRAWYKTEFGGGGRQVKKKAMPVSGSYGKYPAADWFRTEIDPVSKAEILQGPLEPVYDEDTLPPKPSMPLKK